MVLVGTAEVSFKGNESSIKRASKSAADGIRKIADGGKKVESQLKKMGRAFDQFVSRLRNIRDFGLAMKAARDRALEFSRAFDTQIAAQRKLELAIQNTGRAIDAAGIFRLASDLQSVTTFGDEATIEMAALLQTFNLSEEALRSLIPRVQDMSAFMGVDMRTAAQAVGRALKGNVGALSRYGVVLTDVQKKQLAAASSTERLELLSAQLDERFKGTAEDTAKRAAGAYQQLQNDIGDVVEVIGGLIDVPLGAYFRRQAGDVREFGAAIGTLKEEMEDLGKVADFLDTEGGFGLLDEATELAAAVGQIDTGLRGVVGVAAEMGETLAQSLTVVLEPLKLLVKGLDSITGMDFSGLLSFRSFRENVLAVFDAVAGAPAGPVGFGGGVSRGSGAGRSFGGSAAGGGGGAGGGQVSEALKDFLSRLKKANETQDEAALQMQGAAEAIGALRLRAQEFGGVVDITTEELSGLSEAVGFSGREMVLAIDEGAEQWRETMAAIEESKVTMFDLAEVSERVAFAFEGLKKDFTQIGKGLLDTLAGGGFSAVGAQAGAAIGGAVDAAFGTGGAGASIGAILGSVLGDTLDALIESLGVLRPLFDGLGSVVRGLTPILLVFQELFRSIQLSLDSFAPFVRLLAASVAAVLLIFVRIIQVLLLAVDIILLFNTSAAQSSDAFVALIQAMDGFARGMITAMTMFFNAVVDVNNAIVRFIRGLTGDDKFGILLERRGLVTPDILGLIRTEEFGDLEGAIDENTTQLKKFNDTLTNVPEGFRVALQKFRAETPNGDRGGSPFGGIGDVVFNGAVTIGGNLSQIGELKRRAIRQYGSPFGSGSNRGPSRGS